MPYATLSLKVTVSADSIGQATEKLETSLDELALEGLDLYDAKITSACADEPADKDKETYETE